MTTKNEFKFYLNWLAQPFARPGHYFFNYPLRKFILFSRQQQTLFLVTTGINELSCASALLPKNVHLSPIMCTMWLWIFALVLRCSEICLALIQLCTNHIIQLFSNVAFLSFIYRIPDLKQINFSIYFLQIVCCAWLAFCFRWYVVDCLDQ